jgi:hypothetical protein
VLRDSHGKELFDTRDDRNVDELRGAITVQPTKNTDYTMTVYDGNDREECTVGADIEVGGIRWQGGIPLGGTPYTGFEAGPFLTFIFYAVVVIWGGVVAYVLVMRKRALATHAEEATAMSPVTFSETSVMDAPEYTETYVPENLPVAEHAVAPSVEGLKGLEAQAHEKYALFSSDALSYVYSLGATDAERAQKLSEVIANAKARFPKEGDWIVINKERVLSLLG